MAEKRDIPTRVSDQALEMVMRDVLDGMLELSLEMSSASRFDEFEIIEITKEKSSLRSLHSFQKKNTKPAEILPFRPVRPLRKEAC